ncbi:MAG: TetR/AcrR family transcriptional regulator [Clostridium sp.]|uniref:TetR/AcrR family transcriptional regulator n=1 Tax=Clostridium sp. TaxID=1506 RepID=UPI002A85870A|nr:TetR/AcrR family transcriptional regulator [Clostridium sp.]MDY5099288.1 TetR/AcrR family transcriptional regulator [Clostridium sp.]
MKELTARQRQAINTKLKITEKAMELFTKNGFESVKIKDICESANISVGAFYHYFDSKENIIVNAYKEIDIIVEEELSEIEYTTQTDRILKLFEKANGIIENLGFKFIADSYRHIITADNKYTLSIERYPYIIIREAFNEGRKTGEFSSECDPYEAAMISMRIGRGMVFDWCLNDGKYSLVDESRKAILMYLKNYNNG